MDLIKLPFRGFNVILGMDWLTEHGARIDFEMKRLTLGVEGGLDILVGGRDPNSSLMWCL